MINTYALQTIFADKKHWYGFSLTGGLVRQLAYKLRKQGIDIIPSDIVQTLQYMISRGWVVHTGYYLNKSFTRSCRRQKEMEYKQLSFTSQLGLGRIMREAVVETIPSPVCPCLSSPSAAVKSFRKTGMHLAEQEELWVIGLDTSMHERYLEMVYRGTGNMTVISPRDIFRSAVRESCTSVFIAHNHPSGGEASPEDVEMARMLQSAGNMLDIEVTDVFILSGEEWVSFKERGFLQPSGLGGIS